MVWNPVHRQDVSVFRDVINQHRFGDGITRRLYNSTKGNFLSTSNFHFVCTGTTTMIQYKKNT